jgi:ferredoxin
MTMRVRIDRDRCCGNLQCVAIAPRVFSADEEGLGVVLIEEPQCEDRAAVREAAACCPIVAVEITEE